MRTKSRPPRAAAGRRRPPGGDEGRRRQSFAFVGRIKAVDTVAVARAGRGVPREGARSREGQNVKTGDLLYQIEKTQYQAAVDQANANLAAAEARGDSTPSCNSPGNSELVPASAALADDVDQNRAALDTAKPSILQNKAALTMAEENLGYTDIRSPIDGRIGLTTYTLGNLVNPASGVLATIVSDDPIYVEFPVSMRQIADITAGMARRTAVSPIKIRCPRSPTVQEYPASRRLEPTSATRSTSRPTPLLGARHPPQPGAAAGRRRVRHRRAQGEPRRSRAW